jgi:hypothetical protein
MSDQTSFEVQLYSPRWGHEDTYEIQLDREQMRVKGVNKTAVCSWVEGRDPKWSGYNESIGNPLEKILENDSIYPPTVFIRAMEYAWMAWRDGTLDDQKVLQEMQQLCEWVNEVSSSKPKPTFGRGCFDTSPLLAAARDRSKLAAPEQRR